MTLFDLLSGRGLLGGQTRPTTLIDMLGSPATAGTKFEPLARLGALAYGGYMGAGALGAASGAGAGAGYAMPPAVAQAPGSVAAAQAGASSSPAWGNYLQMANLGMGLMGPRGQQPQPVTPQPRQRPQPPQFAANSPYVRMLAMRGLLR